MRRRISIAELQHAGVTFRAAEAVAIAQQLIRPTPRFPPREASPPFGPPSPENVFLDADGIASCDGAEATPAISELAIFMQQLLPPGTLGVPGRLRYTLARALLEVDAPPFDSLDQFSAALARHQPCDAKAIGRGLLDRVAQTNAGVAANIERRRTAPNIADLRRQLRAADARVYEQQLALDAMAEMTAAPPTRTPSRLAITVAAALVLLLFGAWEAVHTGRPSAPVLVSTAEPDTVTSKVAPEVVAPQTAAPAALTTDTIPIEPGADDSRLEAPSSTTMTAPSKRASRSDRPGTVRVRRNGSPKLLDRLHLNWLRSKVAIRAEAP